MSRDSKIIRIISYGLLSLHVGAPIGFVTLGMIHAVEHVFAESRLIQAEESASRVREAGCKSSAEITSNTAEFCPDCRNQQKSSAVMVKYYDVFNYCSKPDLTVLHVKKGIEHFLTHSELNDKISSEPLLPPPRRFTG